jgi:hypothetical protein
LGIIEIEGFAASFFAGAPSANTSGRMPGKVPWRDVDHGSRSFGGASKATLHDLPFDDGHRG